VLQLNLVLMAFNLLLPAYPLDGGRILADLMLIAGVPAVIAAYITITLATLCGAGLIVCGVKQWYFGFGGIIIGVFILLSTFELFMAVRSGNIEKHPLFKPASTRPSVDSHV
jgi:Zn-dependent protease